MLDLEEYLDKTEADLDDTPISFGKYKGKTPDEISDIDPKYLLWLVNEVGFSNCSLALIQYCEQIIREEEDGLL